MEIEFLQHSFPFQSKYFLKDLVKTSGYTGPIPPSNFVKKILEKSDLYEK